VHDPATKEGHALHGPGQDTVADSEGGGEFVEREGDGGVGGHRCGAAHEEYPVRADLRDPERLDVGVLDRPRRELAVRSRAEDDVVSGHSD
jgi:hypothetical protein